MKKSKVKKLIVPMAGLGTRFLPTSTTHPKEMAYLVDRPVLQYLLEEAYESGIEEIIFIINSQKEAIPKYLSKKHHDVYSKKAFNKKEDIPLEYREFRELIQKMKFRFIKREKTLGDGHSILLAKKYIKPREVFAVSMGDLLGFGEKPFIQQLIEVFEDKKRPVVSVEEVPLEATSRFGVVDIKKSYKRLHEVRSIIEKPGPKLAPSRLALTGKYILTPDIFVYLENLVKNHILGEVKLADALKVYAEKKGILAYQCIGSIKDTGNKLDFLKAMIDLSLESKTFGSEVRKYLKSIRL